MHTKTKSITTNHMVTVLELTLIKKTGSEQLQCVARFEYYNVLSPLINSLKPKKN